MTIPSDVLSIMWGKLESPFPTIGHPSELWQWYYENYFSSGEHKIVEELLIPLNYWESMANLFLLILLSEGHSI